jgi:two-component SAPR family response regulator
LLITALIVEDQVVTALDIKSIIKNCGITRSKIISKGKKAIEYIDKTPPTIAFLDIILADDVSGIEVAIKLKTKNIPFIFISAFATERNYNIAKELNPLGMIRKPFPQRKIIQIVNNFIMVQKFK